MQPKPRRSFLQTIATLTALGVLTLAGCARQEEAIFVSADELAELPELHQEQINGGLRQMFGTPLRPRLLTELPPAVADDSEGDEGAEEDGEAEVDGSAEPTEPPTFAFLEAKRLVHGSVVYGKRCAGCHGVSGDGNGPAADYLQPKPRDYRKGIFKFTSTPYGARPARQDLVRTIRRGAKGTSMPAFPWMSQEDLDAVIDYVIYLSIRGQVETGVASMSDDYDEDEEIDPLEFADAMDSEVQRWDKAQRSVVTPVSAEPAYDLASVETGRRLFIKSSCYNCHGADAKGQTEWLSPEFLAAQEDPDATDKVEINYDAWGDPAPAANITARMLHGGRRPLDIYRRIFTGINGTPMPQFDQQFKDDPDAIWHMVHYVMHIVDGGDPTVGISVADVQAAIEAANKAQEAETSGSDEVDSEQAEQKKAA